MGCIQIEHGFLCYHGKYHLYICLEHTTYLMEFAPMFGPSWFTVPDDKNIYPEPDGHLSFLWDIFEDWYEDLNKAKDRAFLETVPGIA